MGRKLKICYLGNVRNVHIKRWVEHFSASGHKVSVLSLDACDESSPDVQYVHIPKWLGCMRYFLAAGRIKKLIEEIKPDILHAHYATGYGLVASLSSWKPLIITAWGSDVLVEPKNSFLYRKMVVSSLNRATLVTSMAHHMTDTLVHMGVEREKIVTLPWGVDLKKCNVNERSRYDEEYDVVCTRHFDPIYNMEVVIRALEGVVRVYPRLKCLLIGDGPQRCALMELSKRLGVDSNIEWKGRIRNSEIMEYLYKSKIFVTMSHSDGNNISLNEAMACGCFPIASDIEANREWIVDGQGGYIVSRTNTDALTNRIVNALENNAIRRTASIQNWKTVCERADWHKNMVVMEDMYESL